MPPTPWMQVPKYGIGYRRGRPAEVSWLWGDIIADITYSAEVVHKKNNCLPCLNIMDCSNEKRTQMSTHPPGSHMGDMFDCDYYNNTYLYITQFLVELTGIHRAYYYRVSSVAHPQIVSILKKRTEFPKDIVKILLYGYNGNQVLTIDDKYPHWDHLHAMKGKL